MKKDLSEYRRKILKLHKDIRKYIQILINRDVLQKGVVLKIKGRCGKGECKCNSGDYFHEVWRLSKSHEGKCVNKVIFKGDLYKVRKLTKNYKKFRKARELLVKAQKEIIRQINYIEKLKSCEYYGKGKFKAK